MQGRLKTVSALLTAVAAVLTTVSVLLDRPRLAYPLGGVAVVLGCWVLKGRITHLARGLFGRLRSILTMYPVRVNATPDMVRDMRRARELVFLGISQPHLHEYLGQALEEGTCMPWEDLRVFFARDDVGKLWERGLFRPNMLRSRQVVAARVARAWAEGQAPDLRQTAFYQCIDALHYTGSMFVTDRSGPHRPLHNVVYVVHDLPKRRPDLQRSWTMRFAVKNSEQDHSSAVEIMGSYEAAYGLVARNAQEMGTFQPSVWDCSANEWRQFCENYDGMNSSMESLVALADDMDPGPRSMLDVGAGTGDLSVTLLQKFPQAELTVLDASPVMLLAARDVLPEERTRFALCQLPIPSPGGDVDVRDQQFDLIVCHLSLTLLADRGTSLAHFARWCRERLSARGRLLLNAHNGMIKFDAPHGWRGWRDPFRQALHDRACERGLERNLRSPADLPDPGEVETVFADTRLKLLRRETQQFRMTMQDRLHLWRVPAILDSFLQIRGMPASDTRELVDDVYESVMSKETKPRQIIAWSFGVD